MSIGPGYCTRCGFALSKHSVPCVPERAASSPLEAAPPITTGSPNVGTAGYPVCESSLPHIDRSPREVSGETSERDELAKWVELAEGKIATLEESVRRLTDERDTWKEHYETMLDAYNTLVNEGKSNA